MSLISVRNVEKHYRLEKTDATALVDVSLDIQAGERVCLMGPSGSGKSTLLNLIGCIDAPSAGSVIVDGEDTGSLGDARLSDFRNRRMGFIFQSFNLIPVLSVFENIEYPLLLQKVPARERRARVDGAAAQGRPGGIRQAQSGKPFRRAASTRVDCPGPRGASAPGDCRRAHRFAGPRHGKLDHAAHGGDERE